MNQVSVASDENEQILLFYVDANGQKENTVVTSIENLQSNIEIEHIDDISECIVQTDRAKISPQWTDEDVNQLLVFYIDNKQAFLNGTTTRSVLWSVACKNLLIDKTIDMCENELNLLQSIYSNSNQDWKFYDLAKQAFSNVLENEAKKVNKAISNKETINRNIDTMLSMYSDWNKNTENSSQSLWENIAKTTGQCNAEYWQKKFEKFQDQYIFLLNTKSQDIKWKYWNKFNKIFENDKKFHSKYNHNSQMWSKADITVLTKYYFDHLNEFANPSIPNDFLWSEIARILEKNAQSCKTQYHSLYQNHIKKYINNTYNLNNREPYAIALDYIISQEVQNDIKNLDRRNMKETDDLIEFLCVNYLLLKDNITFYVCFKAASIKYNFNVQDIYLAWVTMKQKYVKLTERKKMNPDMEIIWKNLDLLDKLFDFGTDDNLLFNSNQINDEEILETEDLIKLEVEETKREETENDPISDQILTYCIQHNVQFPIDNETLQLLSQELGQPKSNCKAILRSFDKSYVKNEWTHEEIMQIIDFYSQNFDTLNSNLEDASLWSDLAQSIDKSEEECARKLVKLKQLYKKYKTVLGKSRKRKIAWQYFNVFDLIERSKS